MRFLRLTITGFAMPDHWGDVPRMMQELATYLAGGNTGKLMVEL